MRDPDQPLRVQVVVYDLLPPSRLSSLLNFIGSGVYHSSVQVTLPLGPTDLSPNPLEYAFGGHDTPGVTGVFSIPAGTAAQRMPGLKHYMTVDLGEAFGEDWEKAFRPARTRLRRMGSKASLTSTIRGKGKGKVEHDAETIAGPPYGSSWIGFSRSSTALTSQQEDPFRDPIGSTAEEQELEDDDDGGESDGTGYMTKAERRAWLIIQDLRRDEDWQGTKYRLLERNCNTFTHELVYRLTGRPAPAWLNRAAWVATSLPCIVPAGWIDEADDAAPSASSDISAYTSAFEVPDPAHALGSEGSVTIAPPRADKMALGGRS
ncbi:hypothetical protein JCM11641_002988 [Rhodosporidiobolus odoratus]